MKVLLIAPGNSPHTKRLIELLLQEDCLVVCLAERNPLPTGPTGYEFIALPGVRGIRFQWFRDHLEAWVRARQFRRIWQRVRPDVVNVQWLDVRAEACAKANLHPVVMSCWGSDINRLFAPEFRDEHDRSRVSATLAKADYITADSPEVLQRCELLAGRPVPAQLFFFGIDPDLFKPGPEQQRRDLRGRLGIPPDAQVVLSPRRFHPTLGQQHILRAFASANVPGAVLVFRHYLTSSTEFEQAVRREVEELGLQSKVFWLGEAAYEDVPAHYAMADLVVSYAEHDGFPVSFFEAALCQRPVLASRLPAYEGALGEALVRVPPANPAALAEALRQCLLEPAEQTRQRVERAYSVAREMGDQRKCVQVLLGIFRELTRE